MRQVLLAVAVGKGDHIRNLRKFSITLHYIIIQATVVAVTKGQDGNLVASCQGQRTIPIIPSPSLPLCTAHLCGTIVAGSTAAALILLPNLAVALRTARPLECKILAAR